MTFDAEAADLTLGLVGTGVMGRGIAQIAALAGVTVLMTDSRAGAPAAAKTQVAELLGRLVEKGRMQAAEVDAAMARMLPVEDLGALATAHVIVEAIAEDLGAKRVLFRQLEAIAPPATILATNTSSLSVTDIAAGTAHPGRIAGFHFFNPVPLMRIVEVVDGPRTEPWVTEGLVRLARRMGHQPFRTRDTPGFIVNHAGRGFGTEALRIAGESVADFATIDRILREAAGFRMGPFELLDLTGLDVSHPVMESIYEQYYQEPRYRPSPIARQRMAAGLLGRKSGQGFYAYQNGTAQVPPEPPPPPLVPQPVWIGGDEDEVPALAALLSSLGVAPETGKQPSAEAICLLAFLGEDATTRCWFEELDPRRTLGVDTLLPLDRRRTLMTTIATEPALRDAAHALLTQDGVAVSVIRDSPGFVAQRVLATIVNIATDMAQQGVAAPADIDAAVKLALGYPLGPLEWGDRIGANRIYTVLCELQRVTGDPRYRPSLWLRRRALLGLSLLAEEA